MRLPDELRSALDEELARTDARALARAVEELTASYKQCRFTGALRSPAHVSAYLAVRLPATYAANAHVFGELKARAPEAQISSLLDLGAGPGTAAWAASQYFGLDRITSVEQDGKMIDVGRRLAASSSNPTLQSIRWMQQDLASVRDLDAHDIVVLSYSIGELSVQSFEHVVRAAWARARYALVIIEPGTPLAFERVHAARAMLLAEAAHIAAPCPHRDRCPMHATGDWCHFAVRLERTSEHRKLKSGAVGYEDEKFCYLIATKSAVLLPDSRVLRHPQIHSGHMQLELCRPQTPERLTVTKSNRKMWRYARRRDWGDAWDPQRELRDDAEGA